MSVIFVGVFLFPSSTQAFFSDTEEAAQQNFTASELLFDSVIDNQEVYVGPGLATKHTFVVPVEFSSSSISNKYAFEVLEITGDEVFCEALALQTGATIGAFESFISGEYLEAGDIDMTVYYDDTKRNIVHNARCTATIEVEAWQSNMSKETAGYRDSRQFTVTAIAHMVVLNEVLPRPNATDTQVPNVEFIELFNNSDFDLNVLGFNITELTTAGLPTNHLISNLATAPASALVAYNGSYSTIVPARGHLALKYRGSSSYLNDSGDRITLIGNDGVAIDTYAFGAALVGKSDARIPDGVGAWVDPIPTPNAENIAEDSVLVVVETATTSVFIELEAASSSDAAAVSTEEVLKEVIVEEEVATSTEDAVEITVPMVVVEEEVVLTPEEVFTEAIEEVVELREIPEIPLTDSTTKDAPEVVQGEEALRTTEEEVEPEEGPVVSPDLE